MGWFESKAERLRAGAEMGLLMTFWYILFGTYNERHLGRDDSENFPTRVDDATLLSLFFFLVAWIMQMCQKAIDEVGLPCNTAGQPGHGNVLDAEVA